MTVADLTRAEWCRDTADGKDPLRPFKKASAAEFLRNRLQGLAGLRSRFDVLDSGTVYLGRPEGTAMGEALHHVARMCAESSAPAGQVFRRSVFRYLVTGTFEDIRKGHPAEHDPSSYRASQIFAAGAFASGVDGVLYRSVRVRGGECLAVWSEDCLDGLRGEDTYEVQWDGRSLSAPRMF